MNISTQNLADEHTLADGPSTPPSESTIYALNTTTPNMANKPTLANGPPGESRIDALNISTQNMADEHMLADGTPSQ